MPGNTVELAEEEQEVINISATITAVPSGKTTPSKPVFASPNHTKADLALNKNPVGVELDREPTVFAGTIRMSLDLTPRMKDIINGMARDAGVSRSDILRQAISLLKTAKDAEHQNQQIALVDKKGKVVAKIIGF